MAYDKIFELCFLILFISPGLIVGLLLPLVDIRYGNTYLFGAFFDRTLYRDQNPLWFWLVEVVQIAFAVLYLSATLPDLIGRLLRLL